MKKIGIIGGLAWPSTVDYYRLLCTKSNAHFRAQGVAPPLPTPPMVIESVNMNETRALRGTEGDDASWERFEAVFRAAFERLRDAGAAFGIIASNTPHMRLKGIVRGLAFPVLSIVDATVSTVCSIGADRALVLGTPVTMASPIYPRALRGRGVEVVETVTDAEIAALAQMIDVDLYQSEIGDARERILALCRDHLGERGGGVACLACTELPLAFPEHRDAAGFEVDGVTFVNTTVAHVEATLAEALA